MTAGCSHGGWQQTEPENNFAIRGIKVVETIKRHSFSVYSLSCPASRLQLVLLTTAELLVFLSRSEQECHYLLHFSIIGAGTKIIAQKVIVCSLGLFHNHIVTCYFINDVYRQTIICLSMSSSQSSCILQRVAQYLIGPREELRKVISQDYRSACQFFFIHSHFLYLIIKSISHKPEM